MKQQLNCLVVAIIKLKKQIGELEYMVPVPEINIKNVNDYVNACKQIIIIFDEILAASTNDTFDIYLIYANIKYKDIYIAQQKIIYTIGRFTNNDLPIFNDVKKKFNNLIGNMKNKKNKLGSNIN